MVTTTLLPSNEKRLAIRPHRGQAAVIRAAKPVVAAIAGTGGGKTVLLFIICLKAMLERPGEHWLFAEPTKEMITRNLLKAAPGRLSLLDILQHVDSSARHHSGDNAIYTKYGTVWLVSCTNPLTMEGAHVAGAFLDEAGQVSKLAFETAQRRAAFKGGTVWIGTTPYNRGWLYKDVFLPWQQGDPDIFVERFSSLANPRYPREVYERNQRNMDPARFRMFHEGGFERPEGMIYKGWDDVAMVVEPFEIPNDWPRFGGLDYGWNHPTAAVWIARGPDGKYYIYEEYRESEGLIAKHFDAMQEKCASQVPRWWDDPAGAQYSAEMRRLGLPVQGAQNEVQAGLDTVAELMASGRLKVFRTCKNWLTEIEGYVWDKNVSGEFKDKPVEVDDDLMDATRYGFHSELKGGKTSLYI